MNIIKSNDSQIKSLIYPEVRKPDKSFHKKNLYRIKQKQKENRIKKQEKENYIERILNKII